ncbi:MAG: formiminotransferase-cyclodeaminase [Deltaproteobacteria bacterium]|jgi:formiminotetrahydrofolate cyclodeaminase|nr:formiminotransferase-cyclodeaminase [Deltaproteobacteria bacterium]
MELNRFLEKMSSDTPTPGGGSASALAGALSASLVAMVAGLSMKKDKTKRKEMEGIREKGLSIQKRLLQATDEDSKSFDAVIKAFRLPRNSEKERLHRVKEIQKAYQRATLIPQVVCQRSLQLLEYSKTLIIKGNPNAISDAGVAAFLADAACAGGLLNIKINLAAVTEKKIVKKMNILMRNWGRKKNQLTKAVHKKLIETYPG